MQDEDRTRYEALFFCQKLEDGFLSGDGARALFIRSRLPLSDLTRIWKLSDVTHDNKLDVFEFSLALYLIELKLVGYEIPKQLSPSLYECAKQNVAISRMTEKERQCLKKFFRKKDTNFQGYLEKNVVQPLMVATGLSPKVLYKVWNIADLDRDGRLSLIEFSIAFHILKDCLGGVDLDGSVNPFLCFPDEENTVRIYKDSLKIFNKEYLLNKKGKEEGSDYFDSSLQEISDSDFDLLVQCMSPAVLTRVLSEGHADVDENSNTYTNETRGSMKYVLENGVGPPQNSNSREANPDKRISEPALELVESQKITKKELSVDLESVFGTVDGEYENASVSDRPVNNRQASKFQETNEEPSEENPPLAVYRRNQYAGMELVFEDPVGSAIIADVEFEVDFDSIISDIQRESMEEERRLPVARVLPIYKTPPVTDEPFIKRKTVKRDIDWNVISDLNFNAESSNDNEVENDPTKTAISDGKDENMSLRQEINKPKNEKNSREFSIEHINNRSTKLDDESSEPKSLKNVDDDVDIVEQKRRIMMNQAEERRKLRERNLANKRVGHPEIIHEPRTVEVEINLRNEDLKKSTTGRQKTNEEFLNRKNDDFTAVEKQVEIVAPTQSLSKGETSGVKMTSKKNGATVVKAAERQVEPEGNKLTTEEVDNAEEDARLEAEEKEKLLLERIKLLEAKRKELLAAKQKQRELELKVPYKYKDVENNIQHDKTNGNMEMNKEEIEDVWATSLGQHRKQLVDVHDHKVHSEEEKKLLSLAVEEKRLKEAELEERRQAELQDAENRRKEEMARAEEEREAAKERKRHFLKNLEILKQRVLTEEAEKGAPKERNRPVSMHSMSGVVTQAMDVYMGSNKASVKDDQRNRPRVEDSKNDVNEKSPTRSPTKGNVSKSATPPQNYSDKSIEKRSEEHLNNLELEEDRGEWRESFKSNLQLFSTKAEKHEEGNSEVVRRKKPSKARPKSYYGGMFNKQPVHQIVDDSLLTPSLNENNLENAPDLVDEEALEQHKREEAFKKEHKKLMSHQRSLDRGSSYTVENIEKIWDVDADLQQPKNTSRRKADSSPAGQTKASANPNRRSLVNTLTTEWNSFIDVLEEDRKRESETVKLRQELSEQRKPTLEPTKYVEITRPSSSEASCSKTPPPAAQFTRSNSAREFAVESDSKVLARQAGNVKKMVNSYKRLSMPCLQDAVWEYTAIIKPDEDSDENPHVRYTLKRQNPLTDNNVNELDIERQQQKTIIKDNAPRRKTDLAHAWSNVVSRQ